MISFGEYPTPVVALPGLSAPGASLWVKRDDVTHPVYGGNKVRKLERLLGEAREAGARRLVTIGAVGSHHVLATSYFGKAEGFEVEAVLVPQPRTEHVVEVLRADLALGLRAVPSTWAGAPLALLSRRAAGARIVPLGGSSVTGALGYVDAARELAAQVRAGELPEPEVCVVALGSGGTAAGLAVGLAAEGLATRVVGVCVSAPAWALGLSAARLVRACSRRVGVRGASVEIDARFLGRGYGHETRAGADATLAARTEGLTLDPTYTAKAFACALWFVRARRAARVLYWHTLSSRPMGPLLAGAPAEEDVPSALRALVLPCTSDSGALG